jgi:ribonuclease HI
MKTLKFSSERVVPILVGTKRTTWRLLDDKNLSVDDEVEFINSATGEAFGIGRITQVTIKRLGDVDLTSDETEETYRDQQDLLGAFKTYYGNDINLDTHVKIVHFEFAAYKKPKKPTAVTEAYQKIKLFSDGGSRGNPGPSACGYVLMDMDDNVLEKAGVYLGVTTNNQAEYLGLKYGLEEAHKRGVIEVEVYMDSMLVVNQMKGIFKVKNRDLWPVHESVKQLAAQFKKVTYTHVPREFNTLADGEVNTTLDAQANK